MKRYVIILAGLPDDLVSRAYDICCGIRLGLGRFDFSYRSVGPFPKADIWVDTNRPAVISALRAELSNYGIEVKDYEGLSAQAWNDAAERSW